MNERAPDQEENIKEVTFEERTTPDEEKPEVEVPVDRFVFTLRFQAVEGGAIIERAGTLPGSTQVFTKRAVVSGDIGSKRLQMGCLRTAKNMLVEHLGEAF